MKKIEIKKLNRVEAPAGEYDDIVAFQMIKFSIDFFGNEEEFMLDSKILKDGRQLVIDGNGWIPDNYEIH